MKERTKILYVDDELTNLMLFRIIYSDSFAVFTAENGEEALQILEQTPDIYILISDMKMPGMDGVELIREVLKKYPDMACFILTGYDDNPEIQLAIKEKMVIKCFAKPINKGEIDMSLAEYVK